MLRIICYPRIFKTGPGRVTGWPGTRWGLLETSKKQCGMEGHRATRYFVLYFLVETSSP